MERTTDKLGITIEARRTPAEGKCDSIKKDQSGRHATNHGLNNGGALIGRQIQPTVYELAMLTSTAATPQEIGRQQLPMWIQQQPNDEQSTEGQLVARVQI